MELGQLHCAKLLGFGYPTYLDSVVDLTPRYSYSYSYSYSFHIESFDIDWYTVGTWSRYPE